MCLRAFVHADDNRFIEMLLLKFRENLGNIQTQKKVEFGCRTESLHKIFTHACSGKDLRKKLLISFAVYEVFNSWILIIDFTSYCQTS